MKIQVKEHVARHQPWTVLGFVRHLPNFVRLFARLLADGRVGAVAKGLLIAAAVYAVSPLDFIPDLFPVLGGLSEGERVVTRGGFLIDSQFQITGHPSLFYPGGLMAGAAGHQHGDPGASRPAPDESTPPPAGAGGHDH